MPEPVCTFTSWSPTCTWLLWNLVPFSCSKKLLFSKLANDLIPIHTAMLSPVWNCSFALKFSLCYFKLKRRAIYSIFKKSHFTFLITSLHSVLLAFSPIPFRDRSFLIVSIHPSSISLFLYFLLYPLSPLLTPMAMKFLCMCLQIHVTSFFAF